MVINCDIILDKENVYAGSVLSGKIVYNILGKEVFKKLSLAISGKAWYKNKDVQKKHSTIGLGKSKERFLSDETILVGSEDGPDQVFEAGTYTYPFKYIIPLDSPSSFEINELFNSHLLIKYKVKVKRETKLFIHEDDEKIFTVVKHLDLNYVPEAKEPVEINKSKKYFWLCCANKPVLISVNLPNKGFSVGAINPFYVDCNNQSNYRINDIIVKLELLLNCHRLYEDGDTMQEYEIDEVRIILSQLSLGPVISGDHKTWEKSLEIPKFQPLQTIGCKVLKLQYIFSFEVVFRCPHRNIKGETPIILGNTPLNSKNNFNQENKTDNKEFPFEIITDLEDLKKIKIKQKYE